VQREALQPNRSSLGKVHDEAEKDKGCLKDTQLAIGQNTRQGKAPGGLPLWWRGEGGMIEEEKRRGTRRKEDKQLRFTKCRSTPGT